MKSRSEKPIDEMLRRNPAHILDRVWWYIVFARQQEQAQSPEWSLLPLSMAEIIDLEKAIETVNCCIALVTIPPHVRRKMGRIEKRRAAPCRPEQRPSTYRQSLYESRH